MMTVPFRCRCQLAALCLLAVVLSVGCNISLEHDPEKTVTVEITGVTEESQREEIQEILKGMTDGSSHLMTTESSGDQMTVKLSPVSDVDAFSRKINFGEVTAVEGRIVKVKYVE